MSRTLTLTRDLARGWTGALTAFVFLYLVGYELYLVFRWGGEEYVGTVSDALQIPLSAAVMVVLWRASREPSLDARTRRGWRLYALSYVAWTVGNVLWFGYELATSSPQFPSWADPFFLSVYPLTMGALLCFSDPYESRDDEVKFWLDSGVVLVAGGMFTWHFLLAPIFEAEQPSSLALAASVAFPVGDLVILFGVLSLLLRGSRQGSMPWFPLVSSLLFLGADSLLVYQTNVGTYVSASLSDMMWAVGFYAALVAGQYQIRREARGGDAHDATTARRSRFNFLPHAAVALGGGLLIYINRSSPDLLVFAAIVLAVLVVYRQILAARLTARALDAERATLERLALVSRATNDAVWDWEAAGQTVWRNGGYSARFGYAAEDVRNDRAWWAERLHPEEAETVGAAIDAAIERGDDAWSGHYRFRRADGSYAHVFDRTFMVRDQAGRLVRALGALTDVSERVALEAQLRQSQKMEAVGRLAGGVAHDFNNLITVIGGYSDVLLAALPPDEQLRVFASRIRDASESAAGLTRQLLAFSRRTVLDPKVLDVNDTVRRVENMLQRLLGADVGLATDLDGSAARVKVDPGQLEQVVMNLAVNARDAMPDGGRLTIATRHEALTEAVCRERLDATPGPHVVLSVSDTGCGMTPEVLARVFEPFFTTKSAGRGTGLGLSTVYGIIRQSEGHLWITSEVGVGSTFEVYLPAVDGEADACEAEEPCPEPVRRGAETILIAEDEPCVRSLAKFSLEELGYEVIEAADGAAALAAAAELGRAPDLLLTDVVMPSMGGSELAVALGDRHPGLRVLFMSGYTDDDVMRRGILHDEVAFLQKPFSSDALAAKVREVLDAPQAPPPPAPPADLGLSPGA